MTAQGRASSDSPTQEAFNRTVFTLAKLYRSEFDLAQHAMIIDSYGVCTLMISATL